MYGSNNGFSSMYGKSGGGGTTSGQWIAPGQQQPQQQSMSMPWQSMGGKSSFGQRNPFGQMGQMFNRMQGMGQGMGQMMGQFPQMQQGQQAFGGMMQQYPQLQQLQQIPFLGGLFGQGGPLSGMWSNPNQSQGQ